MGWGEGGEMGGGECSGGGVNENRGWSDTRIDKDKEECLEEESRE